MSEFHGIIFAYKAYPELGELVAKRTAASLPFCGRYRLIDFALSSMRNAGITDVGIVMQRDYQSLLDHIGSGKAWDMSKRSGGLRMLPPFGLPSYHRGDYNGTIEALNAVSSYIRDIPQKYIVLMLGNLAGNIDLGAVCAQHKKGGAGITAICGNYQPDVVHHRYIVGEDGFIKHVLFDRMGPGEGIPSLEGYVINKDILLELMDSCRAKGQYRFHKDAITGYLAAGGKMLPYVHTSYARFIRTVDGYYAASSEMLDPVNRAAVFPPERPVRTNYPEGVSTYYGVKAKSSNSLVADDCIIEGSIENCVIFSGVRIEEGAELRNCIVFNDCHVGKNTALDYVIADKGAAFTSEISLIGNKNLPIVVPKGATV